MASEPEGEETPKSGFFRDHLGQLSMMRALCFLSFIMAAWCAHIVLSSGRTVTGADTLIVLYFLVGAMAPKAVQKFIELKAWVFPGSK